LSIHGGRKRRGNPRLAIEVCRRCGGQLRVIASIEEQATIERMLEHLGGDGVSKDPAHPSRAPPERDLSF
jgi:hypothetical protein